MSMGLKLEVDGFLEMAHAVFTELPHTRRAITERSPELLATMRGVSASPLKMGSMPSMR
jgi:hypothetical protein